MKRLAQSSLYIDYRTENTGDLACKTVIEVLVPIALADNKKGPPRVTEALPRWLDERLYLDTETFLLDVFHFRPSGLEGQMSMYCQRVVDILITPALVPAESLPFASGGSRALKLGSDQFDAALAAYSEGALSKQLGSNVYQLYLAEPARQRLSQVAAAKSKAWNSNLEALEAHATKFHDDVLPGILETRRRQ
ncbi:uncharacterized protein PFL1_01773 [Pseudozyma flocculosa PF-1]|uniref:Uncharacterized protein n=1 Tax=Pseudozyma flocculosa TaxID=84751 RepID=A0A5C3F007_9BASI|nr:uncharacterized protein PFL1_01773 [Pseudozyma flocculosa PF-1]EPQ30876.1 hypothetical protein PFL1_01773 [Pseudozyma flocculosa PF-1]SPO36749.1 uncharacterized protein PSFLO_02220 [Pseudozyma flocculosa]